LRSVRELTLQLRPRMLDDLGLKPAIEWQTKLFQGQTGIAIELELALPERRFSSEIETTVFRMVQEALTNIARHSGATAAVVIVTASDEALQVEISDRGRGFDAAAALAGVRQKVNYEGQAAIEFEALVDETERESYSFGLEQDRVQVGSAVEALIKDVMAGVHISKITARFHNGLAECVREMCLKIKSETGIDEVVLSGGVWQNITLLGRTLSLLKKDNFRVYLHREVPTNDGGLSLGQAVIAAARLRG